MHSVEIGKLLKASHGKSVIFHGAFPVQFEENQQKNEKWEEPHRSLSNTKVSPYPVITYGPRRHIQSQILQILKSAALTAPGGVLKLVHGI